MVNLSIFMSGLSMIIGPLGFIYGWSKDRELKAIHKRANAPFFKFGDFELDASSSASSSQGGTRYGYKKVPSKLNDSLFQTDSYSPEIPEDYPDNRVLGAIFINTGTPIRQFTFKSKDNILLKQLETNVYSLRYYFKKSDIGKDLFFTISFETTNGVQQKQEWKYIKGMKLIVRVKPKGVG